MALQEPPDEEPVLERREEEGHFLKLLVVTELAEVIGAEATVGEVPE